MENAPVPTDGVWDINNIYKKRPSEFFKKGLTDHETDQQRRKSSRGGAARRFSKCKGLHPDGKEDRDDRDRHRCGRQEMEITSFVSPKAIPQMADAKEA